VVLLPLPSPVLTTALGLIVFAVLLGVTGLLPPELAELVYNRGERDEGAAPKAGETPASGPSQGP